MKIFKYVLEGPRPKILTNADSAILSVQCQSNSVTLWLVVNPDKPLVERRFVVMDTGQTFDRGGIEYVGTVQVDGGTVVRHIFEVQP